MKTAVREHTNAILSSYSEIFFLNGYVLGALFLLLTVVNPNIASAGIIAVVSAYIFANFINVDRQFLKDGFYTYNPLLVGLSIGYLFRMTPLTIFFVVTAGVFTFVVTMMLHNVFSYYFKLPILSIPFVIISSIAYLASSQFSNLFVSGLYPTVASSLDLYLPLWFSGLLKSLGAILFMPYPSTGLLLLLAILFSSRILFLLVIVGYYSGTIINALMIGSFPIAFQDLNSFNFILISIALGGVFFVPSPRSYVLALIAVSSSTILLKSVEVFWARYGIPAFTLPFNLISLSFIYVLGIVRYPLLATFIKQIPEETLDHYLTDQQRFKGHERTLVLPFAGKWRVWQGFDGKWTHQGSWKYAYDFVIADEAGQTFGNHGTELNDYYAFGKPVLSPVRGRVVRIVEDLPDNPVDQADKSNNWGNLVIIYDTRGFYVEISHLKQKSLRVKEGDWVERGSMLGLCGNSGYSPQPHIHVQVQATDQIGDHTLPFSFVNFLCGDQFYSNRVPLEGKDIEPVAVNKRLDNSLTFILDQHHSFAVYQNGSKTDELELEVKMAPDGLFYFDSGKGRLYFGKHEGTFYFYRVEGKDNYLNKMFMALPRLPLAFKEEMSWEDTIPVGSVVSGFKRGATLFLSSFYHDLNRITYSGKWKDDLTVEGEIKSGYLGIDETCTVKLDEFAGFEYIRVRNLELRRKQ